MDQNTRQYLESQILAATPQKLRLMLIEGALRAARQALEQWESKQDEAAMESLIHCRAIVSELLSGVRLDQSELTQQVTGVYMFLFRCLTEAQLRRDRGKVEETISVLEIECQTWRSVCEQMSEAPAELPETGPGRGAAEILAPSHGIGGPTASAFSLDA